MCSNAEKLRCFVYQTQSEVMYESIRRDIHRQAAAGCRATISLLGMNGIKIDRRAYKECYGYQCRYCTHDKACRVGMYEGEWECEDRYKHLSHDPAVYK